MMGTLIAKGILGARASEMRVWGLVGMMVVAISVPGYAEPSIVDNDTVSHNPVLANLAQVSPDSVAAALAKLKPLTGGGPSGIPRGPKPTVAEERQIKQNPDFSKAYQNNPEETLGLLRAVNSLIKASK
jgi:hypothetical protein